MVILFQYLSILVRQSLIILWSIDEEGLNRSKKNIQAPQCTNYVSGDILRTLIVLV